MAETPSAATSPPKAASSAVARQVRLSSPVSLHEASLDSPTFRAVVAHFADQIEVFERWLDGYVKSTSKLAHDILALEETINSYLSKTIPSPNTADGVIDNDYTLLALKRVGDGSREWWTQLLSSMRRMDVISVEPIRNFMNGDLRTFKETRRTLDHAQKTFDSTLARYVAQSKAKEPSSLREDAFTVYETRKAYLKASMDYCQMAPQLRYSLDKLLVRVSADVWREMRKPRDSASTSAKWGDEMERLRGWAKELEAAEATLKRELQISRREIGEGTLAAIKPSRERDDYSASTVPFLGSRGPMNVPSKGQSAVISEKQGWLFLRTVSGKPARVTWVRRWFYCRVGIFGWLIQGPQGVLQGDEIGVLLCGARPAVQEERRFCFELKTKSQNLLLQAETQAQLTEWLEVFEVAKKKAFETSMARDNGALPGGTDPAFSITPPPIPEFSAKSLDAQVGPGDEVGGPPDRSGTLPVPGPEGGLASRPSIDIAGAGPRRAITTLAREEGESSRDHASRLMQRLDLHRKPTFAPGDSPQPSAGIASLISASHNLLPAYTALSPSTTQLVPSPRPTQSTVMATVEPRPSGLAPGTLAKAPISTVLGKAAVIANAERSLSNDSSRGLPTALLANYWGSNVWGTDTSPRKEALTALTAIDDDPFVQSPVPIGFPSAGEPLRSPTGSHKQTVSADTKLADLSKSQEKSAAETFPPEYPPELRAQHSQFRLLFPTVPQDEKLVLVFNAAWSSSSEEGASSQGLIGHGRVYVTPDDMYFYGHSMGLVVAYTISLDSIVEVTAAPGKDCDYIYLHLGDDMNDAGLTRITIKTFLDDMPLLLARLNLLIDNLQAEEPMDLAEIINALINVENEEYEKKSPSVESWEEISANTPIDDGTALGRPAPRKLYDLDGGRAGRLGLARKPIPKLQLPTRAIIYEPEDMQTKVAERHFEISAKACFHVLFGDKSFIFPKLYFERSAKEIAQGPWELADHGKMKRQFKFKVEITDMLGRKRVEDVADIQSIDVFSDHVTYVVTHIKTPWHLPHSQAFKLVTKVVITHVAKSKCKLAVYTKVVWSKTPAFSKSLVERQAIGDAVRDGEELADVVTDQVRKLGPYSRIKRAIQVYGNVGQQKQVVVFTPGENESYKKPQINPRTLTDTILETVRSFMDSVASSLMMWAFAGLKKLFSIVTANRVILTLLALSVVTNVIFTSKESSTWWSERRAVKFMGRIGVGPNVMMSKSIYIKDLEEAAQGTGVATRPAPHESAW